MTPEIKRLNPTLEQFGAYQEAFNYFNRVLFDGQCQPCFLNFSRLNRSNGFFKWDCWSNGDKILHEISLNPDNLDRGLEAALSTLVHEMCHLLRHQQKGKSNAYHDKEWAEIMRSVGLIPYSLDLEKQGKDPYQGTGFKVTHKIEEGGKFQQAIKEMSEDLILPWRNYSPIFELLDKLEGGEDKGTDKAKKKKSRNKTKYSCKCGQNFWGGSGIVAICGICSSLQGTNKQEIVYFQIDTGEKDEEEEDQEN